VKRYFSLILAAFLIVTIGATLVDAGNVDVNPIIAVVKGQPPNPNLIVRKVITAGDYALVNWKEGEGGGQTVLQKKKGKWVILTSGGGQVDAPTLIKAGVPEGYARALTKGQK
jgi:hypothetical protein